MAQVDTGIYQNLLRPVKSVQEYDQDAQQAEGNKLGLLLQRGQYDAQQRGVAQENALSGVYKNALNPDGTVDRSKIYSGAAGAGLGARIPDLQKKFADADKVQEDAKLARSHAANFDSQVKEREFNLKQAQTLQHLQQVGGISSVQDAHAWIDAAEAAGELPPGRAPQVKQALATGQLDLNQWKSGVQNGGLTLMQQRDNEFKAAAQAEQVRNNKAQNGIAARNASTAEGQLGVSRERLNFDKTNAGKEASTGVTYQQDAQGNLVALPKSVTPGQSVTPMPVVTGGTAMQGKGSPKAAFTQQYGMVNGALKEVTDLLPKATASGAGAAADATLGFFGKSTEGGDAAAKLDTLGGWLTSTVPRFEGPQSDRDVMNYQRMAGDVANRKLPVSQRLEAARSLKKLMDDKAKSYGIPVDSGGAPAAAPKPTSPTALKPGAVDGGYRFKGGNPADKSNWEKVQ